MNDVSIAYEKSVKEKGEKLNRVVLKILDDVEFEKASGAKEVKVLERIEIAEDILRQSLMTMRSFVNNYTGTSASKSTDRTRPVEAAMAKIARLYGKKNVKTTGLKVYYDGQQYGNLKADTSYTPDVGYKDPICENLSDVWHAVEVRCGMDSLVKNKQNNTTNLLGRSVEFNDIMRKRSGLYDRNWFTAVGVYEASKLSKNDLSHIISEYLVLHEHFPTALILYDINESGNVVFKHSLTPDVLKLSNFLEIL